MRLFFTLLVPVFVVALVILLISSLLPPEGIRLATGPKDGGYWRIGLEYRSKLARDDISVELVETAGSVENIQLLIDGDVDVAFVQGGIPLPGGHDLESLGALFPEPLVIFRRSATQVGRYPGDWRGIRLAAGQVGSGTRAAALALIEAAGLQDSSIELQEIGGFEAIAALRAGEADAALFVSPLDAPYLTEAIVDPELDLVRMALIDALSFKFVSGHSVVVPAGSTSLAPPRPAQNVKILTLTASMIATNELHPAVVDRLVHSANKIQGDRTVLQEAKEFPNTNSPPAPINDVAWHMINSGPNILHDIFPFWVAAQFGRVLLFLLPLFFLAPLLRLVPALYVWFQNRRVWRHYQHIASLEAEIEYAATDDEVEAVAKKLDDVAATLANLNLPLAYRQKAYDARLHIELIAQEIVRRRSSRGEKP
ncbi:TAXI family TRAP transporter solute-binding subunit [Ruegeria hyattellae]|uniref:TAXI family TRAP transporter solute-binding subunit n=1 Tax=Ruegeria hyattellae TaxID=3233337 RepID=UPI00355B52B4